MGKKIDLTGQRFGRLTAIRDTGKKKWAYVVWQCQCDCGSLHEVVTSELTKGKTKSCGCLVKDAVKMNSFKHGGALGGKESRLYSIWCGMKSRCYDKNNIAYKNYGGRGIKVCDWWKKSYQFFKLWALHAGYKPGLTIDRINNNGHYCLANCQWLTRAENAHKGST